MAEKSNNAAAEIEKINKRSEEKKRRSPTQERLAYDFKHSRKAQFAVTIIVIIILLA